MSGIKSLIKAGTVYALTLGRGGSKGLPGKNVKLLGNHPLIAWSIAAGKLSRSIERVLCSTDDEEIARVAARYGADVPFHRPAALASDDATDLDVFNHCIEWLAENEGSLPEVFVQLRPTTPFRLEHWIDEGVKILRRTSGASSVRSVAPTPLSPYKMWRPGPGGRLLPAMEVEGITEAYNRPRQSLPNILWHTGQLDVFWTTTLIEGSMTGPYIQELRVPLKLAVDIDDLIDFQVARLKFEELMPKSFITYLNTCTG
ncbi:acylneuraminate cytidylyltransferase family protein [Rhizobium rhizophilum]|nr:acylneuraminate cytidylyltransferase family protein [Rhizobium rhizophilum]